MARTQLNAARDRIGADRMVAIASKGASRSLTPDLRMIEHTAVLVVAGRPGPARDEAGAVDGQVGLEAAVAGADGSASVGRRDRGVLAEHFAILGVLSVSVIGSLRSFGVIGWRKRGSG